MMIQDLSTCLAFHCQFCDRRKEGNLLAKNRSVDKLFFIKASLMQLLSIVCFIAISSCSCKLERGWLGVFLLFRFSSKNIDLKQAGFVLHSYPSYHIADKIILKLYSGGFTVYLEIYITSSVFNNHASFSLFFCLFISVCRQVFCRIFCACS